MKNLAKMLLGCLFAALIGLIGNARAANPPLPEGVSAAQDPYAQAEQQRREAIAQQRQLVEQARWNYHNYAYTYNPRKAYRQAVRYGYPPAYYPYYPYYGTRGPSDFLYRPPYYGAAKMPVGHEKIWTSPNGYIYRPLYPQPPAKAVVPSQRPPVGTQQPVPPPPEPVSAPEPVKPAPEPKAAPEPIPAPPNEPGPREF